jgi:hypothetical protein
MAFSYCGARVFAQARLDHDTPIYPSLIAWTTDVHCHAQLLGEMGSQ